MKFDLSMVLNSTLIGWFTGTTKVKNLDNNIGSLAVKLTQEDLKEICDAVPINEVGGERFPATLSKYTWKVANTPSKWLQIIDMKTKHKETLILCCPVVYVDCLGKIMSKGCKDILIMYDGRKNLLIMELWMHN